MTSTKKTTRRKITRSGRRAKVASNPKTEGRVQKVTPIRVSNPPASFLMSTASPSCSTGHSAMSTGGKCAVWSQPSKGGPIEWKWIDTENSDKVADTPPVKGGGYETMDSGKREEMTTGSVRDIAEGKGKPSLVSPFMEKRLWALMERGAKKYAARNFELGQPFDRVIDSLKRHVCEYQLGERKEDHLAAVCWNAMALIHYEEMIARGKLPKNLDNLPRYID